MSEPIWENEKRVLVIDDDPAILALSRAVLVNEGFEVEVADSGTLGLELIPQFKPHVLLLDVNMPRINGLETLAKIRQSMDYISVIFVSANSKIESVVKGLDSGADDYLRKPYDPRELSARVRAQVRIKELHDQLKQANFKLQELVDIDDLTGLYNMRSIYERIEQELNRGQRFGRNTAVIMMDMDRFKTVNDTFDHLFGSAVLKDVGRIIFKVLRKVDFAARYGGDEFLIVLTETETKGTLTFCERLRKAIKENPFQHGGQSINLTASLGVAISNSREKIDARALVRSADRALYLSKESGRDCIHLFDFSQQKALMIEGDSIKQ